MDQEPIFETTEHPQPRNRHDEHARQELARELSGLGIHLDEAAFERAYMRASSNNLAATPGRLRSIVEDVQSGSEVLEGVAESFR